MSSLAKKFLTMLLALPLLLALSGRANTTIILPAPILGVNSLLFGDFNVYSLILLNFLALGKTSKPTGQDPFLAQSADGLLLNDIVVSTQGAQARNNDDISSLIEDGFESATGTTEFFGTQTATDPEGANNPVGIDMSGTWDADLGAIRDFLLGDPLDDSDDSIFAIYTNLNETGTDDELAGNDLLTWAVVTLWDGVIQGPSFYLSGPQKNVSPDLVGPTPNADGSPAPGTDTLNNITGAGGSDDLDDRWAYVHGRICVSIAPRAFIHLGPCTDAEILAGNVATLDQNLGSDRSAFVLFNQTLNDLILDPNSGFDKLTIDYRLAVINNGPDKVYFRATQIEGETKIPEPGTLSLFGLGLLALGIRLRRRKFI